MGKPTLTLHPRERVLRGSWLGWNHPGQDGEGWPFLLFFFWEGVGGVRVYGFGL